MTESKESTVRLLITCPDQPGIVAAVSGYLQQKKTPTSSIRTNIPPTPKAAVSSCATNSSCPAWTWTA